MTATATKIKFPCPKCKANLSTTADHAGELADCIKCNQQIRLPYPGMRRLPYAGYSILTSVVSVLISKGLAQSDGSAGILLIFALCFIGVKIALAIQRGINIGYYTWKSVLICLIPFGPFYLMYVREGSSKDIYK